MVYNYLMQAKLTENGSINKGFVFACLLYFLILEQI